MSDHVWTTSSRHVTSDGVVVYESCHCGLVRIRLLAAPSAAITQWCGPGR